MPGGSIKKRKVSHGGGRAWREDDDNEEHRERIETKKKKKEMKVGIIKEKKVEVSGRVLRGEGEVVVVASAVGPKEGMREKRDKVKKVRFLNVAKQAHEEGEEGEGEGEEGDQEVPGQGEDNEKEEIAERGGGIETAEEANSLTSHSGPSGDGAVPAKSFKELGVMDSLCEACENLGYKNPTAIQVEAIPAALQGKDVIGLAETGSGKTAAFALPILQGPAPASLSISSRLADDLTIALWDRPTGMFACVLAPTRELAFQISEQFEALGGGIGVRCAVIVGGMDMMTQSVALGKMPHIVVATPGRLLDHLENTKGFSLRNLKYLVMDEADRLLDMDFGPILDKILKVLPMTRRTYLFSATMTSKVEKLQRASLSSPVRVSVSSKYSTVSTLIQKFLFIPFKHKDTYLVYLMNEFAGQTIIIFCRTVQETSRLAILLRHLGFKAVPLNGQMSQSARLGALNKFKSGSRNILVATDVAARGLDIPSVDCVINHDLAQDSKTYIHRVGRTARAGRSGRSISIVTQYDVELFLRIEAALGKKIPEFEVREEDVLIFSERVGEAQREAAKDLREGREKKGGRREGRSGGRGGKEGMGGKRRRDEMDREEE